MTTEIFVLGKTKNPAIQRRAWARYMIVCVRNNGTEEKRDGVVCINNATTKKDNCESKEVTIRYHNSFCTFSASMPLPIITNKKTNIRAIGIMPQSIKASPLSDLL